LKGKEGQVSFVRAWDKFFSLAERRGGEMLYDLKNLGKEDGY